MKTKYGLFIDRTVTLRDVQRMFRNGWSFFRPKWPPRLPKEAPVWEALGGPSERMTVEATEAADAYIRRRLDDADLKARTLNEAIRAVFAEYGETWNPSRDIGVWVENRGGRLYLCDANEAFALADAGAADDWVATPEWVARAAREWLEDTG